LKRHNCRKEDGASFEVFFGFFESVVGVIWRVEVKEVGMGEEDGNSVYILRCIVEQ
jgi:hypothetical protein